MSEMIIQNETQNSPIFYFNTIEEALPVITNTYLELCDKIYEIFKNHNDMGPCLEAGIRNFKERLQQNNDQVLYNLSDNFLYCLEPLKDMNSDYFIYQTEKIRKKSGKVEKLKVSRLIGKAQMKIILKEVSEDTKVHIFKTLIQCFRMLLKRKEGGGDFDVEFFDEYNEFVRENLNDSKNYSKMLTNIENVELILDETSLPENFVVEEKKELVNSYTEREKKKKENNKKSANPLAQGFMKNLESTKIAKLAQNISSKINEDQFPMLNDPSKLLSSLSGGGEDGVEGLGNLLNFVVGEVKNAMDQEGMTENDLMGEATNLMGSLKNITGFDPMSMFGNMMNGGQNGDSQEPDLSQLDSIFQNLNLATGGELGQEMGGEMPQFSTLFKTLNQSLGEELRKMTTENNQNDTQNQNNNSDINNGDGNDLD